MRTARIEKRRTLLPRMDRAVTWLRRGLLLAIGAPLLLALTMALAVVPTGSGDSPPFAGEGRTIAIVDNGFHTDIGLPPDGTTLAHLGLAASDFPVDVDQVRWWGVGWGSRSAYTSLRAVSDLSLATVARAVSFDRSVMHVAPWGELIPGPHVRFVTLSEERYVDLLRSLAGDFAAVDAMEGITQGFGDRFYEGRGRFTAWFGCNAWVGAKLHGAGVPVGLWTLTAQSLSYGLDRIFGGTQR